MEQSMSHYTLTVALPGGIPSAAMRPALAEAMARFDENRDVELHRDTSVYAETFAEQLASAKASGYWTEGLTDAEIVAEWHGDEQFDSDGWPLTKANPDGQWDWWVIGGRWGGAWALRDGAEDGPLKSEDHAFGREERADMQGRTDNARWGDIVPESVTPTYAWLDLAGEWHTRWVGPRREEAVAPGIPDDTSHWTVPETEHHAGFMKFLVDLPSDAWLVHIDFHS
jgi:hypothetical protein